MIVPWTYEQSVSFGCAPVVAALIVWLHIVFTAVKFHPSHWVDPALYRNKLLRIVGYGVLLWIELALSLCLLILVWVTYTTHPWLETITAGTIAVAGVSHAIYLLVILRLSFQLEPDFVGGSNREHVHYCPGGLASAGG